MDFAPAAGPISWKVEHIDRFGELRPFRHRSDGPTSTRTDASRTAISACAVPSTGGRGRETDLDDVHSEAPELARNADLLVLDHRRAGRLFTFAQSGVDMIKRF